MKFKLFLIIVFSLLVKYGYSQNSGIQWFTTDKALDTLFYRDANYEATIEYINKHYPNIESDTISNGGLLYNMHTLVKSQCFSYLNQNDSAFASIYKIGPRYFRIHSNIVYCESFNNLRNTTEWDEFIDYFFDIHLDKNIGNRDLAIKLFYIYTDDQRYRGAKAGLTFSNEEHKKEIDSLNALIRLHDSINLIKVKTIVEEYGWPTKELVGRSGVSAAFLVIQHSDIENQKKYIKNIKKASKRDKDQLRNLALMTDRIRLKEGKKQLYGTQFSFHREAKAFELLPVKKRKYLNKRRKKMGFTTTIEEEIESQKKGHIKK